MKHKKRLYLIIAGCVILFAVIVVYFQMDNNKKMIKEFLNVSLTKSDENVKLYEMFMESRTIIGEGVDEKAQEDSLKKAEEAEKEFAKAYEKYLDAHGLQNFEEKLYPYISSLHTENEKCEISNINIVKDNDYYKFKVTLALDNKEQGLEGRIEIVDDKINSLELTNP